MATLILFFDPDAAARRPCCKCSGDYIGLLPHYVLKLPDLFSVSPETVILTQVNFSKAYISYPGAIFVKSTWESMQFCFVISKFVFSLNCSDKPTYVNRTL